MNINEEIAGLLQDLSNKIYVITGDKKALVEIKVTPRAFDRMVVDAHRYPLSRKDENDGALPFSSFTPSDAYNFNIRGIKISPSLDTK